MSQVDAVKSPKRTEVQRRITHWQAQFLKVPRGTSTGEPLGVLEQPGQDLRALPPENSLEPLVTRAAGGGS